MGCFQAVPSSEGSFYPPETDISPGRIERITLDYTRPLAQGPEGAAPVHRVAEHLVLDRFSQTLQMSWERETGSRGSCRYALSFEVQNFLDCLEKEGFLGKTYPSGPDGVEEPASGKDLASPLGQEPIYLLTIDYYGKPQRIFSGPYDREGLPDDFPLFMELFHLFMQNLGLGELPLSKIYSKPHRYQGQLIYCSVSFGNSRRTYYYTTQDETLEQGDWVVVPTGKGNHMAIATIVEIQYFAKEEVPFPLEKTKKILRRCTEEDYELLGIAD